MFTSSISAGASGGSRDGSRFASIDLPAPGGPIIRRLPSGGGHFEHALGGLLALDVAQVRHRFMARVGSRQRTLQRLQAFEVIDELKQDGRREDRHVGGGPGGLCA